MIAGAFAATLLGAITAFEFERIAAVGLNLMLPTGQAVLWKAALTAGLSGFLIWVACALLVRTVSRIALSPYNALADRLDSLVDGNQDNLAEYHGPIVGVRRLARAVFVFRDRAIASHRSEVNLQAKYDALYQEHADERRLLMTMLTGRLDTPADRRALQAETLNGAEFDIPRLPDLPIELATASLANGPPIDLMGQLTFETPRTPDLTPPATADQAFGFLDLTIARRH